VRCKVGDGSTNVKDLPFDENTRAVERILGTMEEVREKVYFEWNKCSYGPYE
jgi:hypothetical protein